MFFNFNSQQSKCYNLSDAKSQINKKLIIFKLFLISFVSIIFILVGCSFLFWEYTLSSPIFESMLNLLPNQIDTIDEITSMIDKITNYLFSTTNPPYFLMVMMGLGITLWWRVAKAEHNLRNKLIKLFDESFVLAYYAQYAFLREIIRIKKSLYILDPHIDEFLEEIVDYPVQFGLGISKHYLSGQKIPDKIRYDLFLKEIDVSRYTAGKMLSTIRIELGDDAFANEYREYIKHARKTSYLIHQIIENKTTNIVHSIEDAIFSLQTSDQIKMNFEKKLRYHSIHWNILTKFLKSLFAHLFFLRFLKFGWFSKDPKIKPMIICDDGLSDFSKWFNMKELFMTNAQKIKTLFGISFIPEIHRMYGCKNTPHMIIFQNGEDVCYDKLQTLYCDNCKENLKIFRT